MKLSLLILILFTKSCSSQEVGDKQETNKIINEILIEFKKPIEGFDVTINWTLKDTIIQFSSIIGPAIIKINRLSDNKVFKIDIQDFTVQDTITGINTYERYKEKSVPNVLQLKTHPNIYFKDINFDQKKELVISYTYYDQETIKTYTNNKIFELLNDELTEIDYFPSEALNWNGEIDYAKQEVIIKDYFNCCSYEASYFRYDPNSKEKFIFYKSENHNIDATNGNDEITVEEKGKKKVTIFKKGN